MKNVVKGAHQSGFLKLFCFMALGGALIGAPAYGQIYRCVDPAGHVTFSNVTSGKDCKKMELEPVRTIPSSGSGATVRSTSRTPGAASNPSPVNFPRVSEDTQKARDNDRRAILQQELGNEKKSLEQARKELAEQESIRLGSERNFQRVKDRLQPFQERVAQHERNIQALEKEIGNLK